jgi:hypothetical protein
LEEKAAFVVRIGLQPKKSTGLEGQRNAEECAQRDVLRHVLAAPPAADIRSGCGD